MSVRTLGLLYQVKLPAPLELSAAMMGEINRKLTQTRYWLDDLEHIAALEPSRRTA